MICGDGPIGFEVRHCYSRDGEGHLAGHFQLNKSWLWHSDCLPAKASVPTHEVPLSDTDSEQPDDRPDDSEGATEVSEESLLFDANDIGSTESSHADPGSAAEDTLVEEADPTPQQGLSVQPWFCAKILNGEKIWELRGRTSNCRARVAIAAKGTGKLWGEVNIVSSVLVARKNKRGRFCPVPGQEAAFPGHRANYARHCVSDLRVLPYSEIWAWSLEGAEWYQDPRPYRHPKGQMSWIRLATQADAGKRQRRRIPQSTRTEKQVEKLDGKGGSKTEEDKLGKPKKEKKRKVTCGTSAVSSKLMMPKDNCKAKAAADLSPKQASALGAWQLSEIQSANRELTDFLALGDATVEDFVKILNLVPKEVRHAFGIKLKKERTRLPKNLAEVLERLKSMIQLAERFWHAQAAPAQMPET